MKAIKNKREEAKKSLEKIRRLIAQHPSPIFRMSKEEVIKTIRKTREKLWEGKLASHS